jgi:hypothetical protein
MWIDSYYKYNTVFLGPVRTYDLRTIHSSRNNIFSSAFSSAAIFFQNLSLLLLSYITFNFVEDQYRTKQRGYIHSINILLFISVILLETRSKSNNEDLSARELVIVVVVVVNVVQENDFWVFISCTLIDIHSRILYNSFTPTTTTLSATTKSATATKRNNINHLNDSDEIYNIHIHHVVVIVVVVISFYGRNK